MTAAAGAPAAPAAPAAPPEPAAARCPACGGEAWAPLVAVRGYTYARCRACTHAQLDPLPSPAAAGALYGAAYFAGTAPGAYADYERDAALHTRNARARLALLERLGARPPGVLVDVGCATGYVLAAAAERGWAAMGVDVSAWARGVAAARSGAPVVPSLADLPDRPAGAVTFFQSLEHLADPAAALTAARARLAPGGVLVVETWDRGSLAARLSGAHWQQLCPPSVVHLFDRASLTAALGRAGFRDVAVRASGKWVSVGLATGLLAGKYPAAFGPVDRLARRTGAADVAVRYRLGDLVTATARA